jgi:hypothetical protein
MFRRGRLQRSLITLLALLIVTPQVLLRPCCCAQERSATLHASAETPALPACCQKRLQAAQQAAAANSSVQLPDTRPGVHDSSQCKCRVGSQLARSSRAVFNSALLRHLVVWLAPQTDDASSHVVQAQVLTHSADSAFPDWGPDSCARLCRWLV